MRINSSKVGQLKLKVVTIAAVIMFCLNVEYCTQTFLAAKFNC